MNSAAISEPRLPAPHHRIDDEAKADINAGIDATQAQGATGTFIPAGLVWGWHVLSSTEPLTEGISASDANYKTTVKAIVLMSDGANSPTVYSNANHNQSTY